MKCRCQLFFLISQFLGLWGCIASEGYGLSFSLPPKDAHVIGHLQWMQAQSGDTLSTIGERYGVGYYALVDANPGVESAPFATLNPGAIIVIPTRFILPPVPRKDIVINLAELRLYLYTATQVHTYPLGIGRQGWDTPLGASRIIEKRENPTWYVPASIREDSAKEGVILPIKVLPGPDNPLGKYALRLQQPTYLIHSTNDARGVGSRSSAGCLRMFPKDAKHLFERVRVGTRLNIINKPHKVGWDAERLQLYLEAHVPLESATAEEDEAQTQEAVKLIAAMNKSQQIAVSTAAIKRIILENNGIPQPVGNFKPIEPESTQHLL